MGNDNFHEKPSRVVSVLSAGVLAASVAAGSPAAADTGSERFAEEATAAMNTCRAAHGAHELRLDEDLTQVAQTRADELFEAGELETDTSHGYGENVAVHYSFRLGETDPEATVRLWYEQIEDYDFADPGYAEETGAFTQLVWNSSRKVGVAATSGQGEEWFETYVVAVFDPPGNYDDQFEANVHPLADADQSCV